MHSARFPLRFCGLLALLLAAEMTSPAVAARGPLADNGGLVRAREPVPDDPLAGLPAEGSGRPRRPTKSSKAGNAKAAATCFVDGKPANQRDIGDLRATLAVVQRGPRYLPCPSAPAGASSGLRITVDGSGKISKAEPVGAPADAATAIAKKVSGKTIAARREGATTGTVWLVFTPNPTR